MKTSWLVPVALALFLSAPASGKTPRAAKAPARSSGIYSQQVYEGARESLAAGDLPGALQGFCDMVTRPKGQAVWTVSVVLLCDAAEIPQAYAVGPHPSSGWNTTRVM